MIQINPSKSKVNQTGNRPDYDESIDWLYGVQVFGIKLGLENVSKLLDDLDLFSQLRGRDILHVAGTNGKGSVCAFAEQILRDGGLKTGLFTSPHLISFSERIRVNGSPADEESIAEKIALIRKRIADWGPHPTFFEITLAIALLHFCERDCEAIVLETGLGGRLDATNAVTSSVSVITKISLDHQQWLGEDIESIAREKAGIIKAETPVIIGEHHPIAREVIGREALRLGSPLIEAHPLPEEWELGLAGQHQRENAALAVEAACRLAGDRLTQTGIQKSLRETRWPGRFQIFRDSVIVDGAHNEAAAAALAETWIEEFGKEEMCTLVFGAARGKDVCAILKHLAPLAARIYWAPIRSERRLSADEMKRALKEAGFAELPNEAVASVASAMSQIRFFPEKTLVAGSLFLAGEVLALFNEQNFESSSQ